MAERTDELNVDGNRRALRNWNLDEVMRVTFESQTPGAPTADEGMKGFFADTQETNQPGFHGMTYR